MHSALWPAAAWYFLFLVCHFARTGQNDTLGMKQASQAKVLFMLGLGADLPPKPAPSHSCGVVYWRFFAANKKEWHVCPGARL
jgi:hypothetical protein